METQSYPLEPELEKGSHCQKSIASAEGEIVLLIQEMLVVMAPEGGASDKKPGAPTQTGALEMGKLLHHRSTLDLVSPLNHS